VLRGVAWFAYGEQSCQAGDEKLKRDGEQDTKTSRNIKRFQKEPEETSTAEAENGGGEKTAVITLPFPETAKRRKNAGVDSGRSLVRWRDGTKETKNSCLDDHLNQEEKCLKKSTETNSTGHANSKQNFR